MKHWIKTLLIAVVALGPAALPVRGADDEERRQDARLTSYKDNVQLEERTAPITWMIFWGLAALCIAALFKSAKRTHLD